VLADGGFSLAGDGEAPPEDLDELLRRRYAVGVAADAGLPHRVGRNAIAGLLPDETELVMIDTACSSALYAMDLGVRALREGCELAVCGGVFGYTARNLVLFAKLSGLSRDGEVRCFDEDASGVLLSDGAAVVVLKRLRQTRQDGDRVLGVIDGIGLACDGRGKSIYAPNDKGQTFALSRAYADAGVAPATVDWVIAHATGTRAGDSTELAGLNRVMAPAAPPCSPPTRPSSGTPVGRPAPSRSRRPRRVA
jgi:acyl transferase domain-containing protein